VWFIVTFTPKSKSFIEYVIYFEFPSLCKTITHSGCKSGKIQVHDIAHLLRNKEEIYLEKKIK